MLLVATMQIFLPAISCTIIAFNEADRIAQTLSAAGKVCDEIVVVDSGSTDGTQTICESLGARVVHNDWPGYGPQKRFAEDQAAHDWILNLDADEVPTQELLDEIATWKRTVPQLSGYRFRQTTVYPGRAKPRPFADHHTYVRLYDRRVMRFRNSLVHDVVDSDGHEIGRFEGDCLHWSWRSLDHLARKLDGYTTLQAKEIRRPAWKLWLRRPIEYPVLLFRYALLKRHITGGLYGIRAAHTIAKGRAARIPKILAAQANERV
ncbi:glycosyltransferase family 2 protein [Ahrensia sp. R2A130]|uniref:glycosyltransferase family 2 protein n=1 Tax=Ahrensia sp. R2A130 TaxID=744979 RepID=UPI0001E0D890|nr:glycosyltransferase family 2 protein [Ahrensia sp. R2A130]EFL87933.1 glycosyl transferase family protein [Ahrensia sp. R2A130]